MTTETTNYRALPLIPIEQGVIAPGMVVNIVVESTEASAAVEAAERGDAQVVLVPQVDGRYARIGTVAQLEHVEPLADGRHGALIRGVSRAVVGAGVPTEEPGLWVSTTPAEETPGDPEQVRKLMTEYRAVAEGLLERRGEDRAMVALAGLTDPSQLADTALYAPEMPMDRKVEVLETLDVAERLEKVLSWGRETLAEAEVADRIRTEVTDNMEKTQREYVLRQQMDAIKRELDEDGDADVPEQYRTKLAELDERGTGVPVAVREQVEREIDRLERTSEQSPEHSWIRTWLDWMTELPWGVTQDDPVDLTAAQQILDDDHTGLEQVKERLVEHLAVRKLRTDRGLDATGTETGDVRPTQGTGAILTLIGPPGVGKTSLGASVARAMGRKFVRIALGGVRDEAEIRGHRRTYVGAQPGRIARAIRDAGTMNPVIMLDEIDKVGADWRGDPSSALLEVLDPAQNHTFADHYLESELDLSNVLFIATGNVADTIPPALLDRMEVTYLDGYTDMEKAVIAKTHLLPKLLEQHGLANVELTVADAAVDRVIAEYTREAGVRGLQREVATLVRKSAAKIATDSSASPVHIESDQVRDLLGRRRVWHEDAQEATVPGVVTGLAVTGAGGEVLFVEASASDGEQGLTLTGQLGDVMKESANIALSHLRANADPLGYSGTSFDRRFHMHVPAGATPKDGPSAGIAMTVALASLLADRPVRSGVGMTGEVTLSGRVLPVGGIKGKVLAAHRAGLREVILPERNEGDLEDVPETVRNDLTIHLVSDIATALELSLGNGAPVEAAA